MALAGSMKYVCETALGFLPTAATKPKSDLTRIIIIKRDLIKQHFLVKCENYGCVFFRSDQLVLENQHEAL